MSNTDDFPICHISFRIIDDSLNPGEISDMFCIEPDVAHKKGDPNISITRKGKRLEHAPFRIGVWSIHSTEEENKAIECHIEHLLSLLEPKKEELLLLSDRGYQLDMFCGLFFHGCPQAGFTLDATVLKRIGDLNITLGVCFY